MILLAKVREKKLIFLGKINCNGYNCELHIIERDFYLDLVKDHKFGGYTNLEFKLNDNEEYYIKEEVENETFLDPLIYIVNSETNKAEIRLSSYRGTSPYNEDEFVLLDKEKIKRIQLHINELNQKSSKAIKRRKESFLDNVINKTRNNEVENRKLIYNFIGMYPPMFIYEELNYLHKFETIVYKNLSIGEHLSYKHQYKDPEEKFEKLEDNNLLDDLHDYQNYFLKLVKVIEKREDFGSEDEAIYYTWLLFNEEVCHYYYDQFYSSYNVHFPETEDLSLEGWIQLFSNIETLNLNSSETITLFTFYLMHLKKFHENDNYVACYNEVANKISIMIEEKKMDYFESLLLTPPAPSKVSIHDIDLMGGHDFEALIADLFTKMGYKAYVTTGSGDQGVDVIAEKNGKRYGIQTKCYSGKVSNTAIQEVVGGLRYYKLEKGIVITNNYFTKSAKELAHSNNVILWDRDILKEKINSLGLVK